MRPRTRGYRPGDLGRVVGLCERAGLLPVGPDGLTIDDIADLVASDGTETLLAEAGDGLVGLAIGSVTGSVASLHRLVGEDDVLESLLDELGLRLADRGARTFTVAVRADDELHHVLTRRGYQTAGDMVVLRRDLDRPGTDLAELGGRRVDPDLWDRLEGMQEVKDVIERRIILPLARPDLAATHGVAAPQSVVLFGPPGTGKTTFAKGVASRLGWPFVPVEVSQLAGDRGDDPTLLSETFDRILDAPEAVAFLDEVEDVAADRQSARRVSSRVTNEFLRQLPRLRDSSDHLLVCATNSVSSLDPAFLRPGRFDYVVPVGPPDARAREAIWRGYISDITDEDIDVDALVERSARFTPADIEFAARKAAQLAFESAAEGISERRARTEQFLEAIDETRPTVTDEMIATFEQDAERFARY